MLVEISPLPTFPLSTPSVISNAGDNPGTAGKPSPVSAGTERDVQANDARNVHASVVQNLNADVQNLNRKLEFTIDEQNGDVMAKVVDTATLDVIRQIPSKEAVSWCEA